MGHRRGPSSASCRGAIGAPSPLPTSRSATAWLPSCMPRGRGVSILRLLRSRCSRSWASTPAQLSSIRFSMPRFAVRPSELNRLAGVQADFLRGVTHDLQTPLTSIAALATELRAGEDLSEEARGDLDSIAHQAERLRRMVSQLLVASRLDAGVFTPQQEVFAVRPLVERTSVRHSEPISHSSCDETGPAASCSGGRGQAGTGVVGRPRQCRQVQPRAVARCQGGHRREGTGCWRSPSAITAPVWMLPRASAGVRAVLSRPRPARRLAPDGSGVGLYAGQRPDAGDGWRHRDQRRCSARGTEVTLARACLEPQRRGLRVGPRYWDGPRAAVHARKVPCKVLPL